MVVAFLRAETDSKSGPLSVRFTANAVHFLHSECLLLAHSAGHELEQQFPLISQLRLSPEISETVEYDPYRKGIEYQASPTRRRQSATLPTISRIIHSLF